MIKKRQGVFTALMLNSMMCVVNAQTNGIEFVKNGFNKWSIEMSGGVNKPQSPMTSGYFTSTPSMYVVDLGARYMLNNKFGLKADFGYNSFEGKNNSSNFKTKYYRTDLQAVANMGRIMNFETWTNSIGLLGHAGFGLSQLEGEHSLKDRMGNFIAGLTGQIKLTDRLVLTGDFTTILNASQDVTFDGKSPALSRGFSGLLFNGTAGLTVYLGKNKKHADWTIINNVHSNEDLEQRVSTIEVQISDKDKDGVFDYLDLEKNSPSGVLVDSKGRQIDEKINKISNQEEDYVKPLKGNDGKAVFSKNEIAKELINDGYICAFFDHNKSVPTNVSNEEIYFVRTYLKNNPTASVDIIGHADETGMAQYNNKLSKARAQNIKNILLKSGIESSRLNVVGAGEDMSVNKNSAEARKLSRRVTFKIK